MGNHLMTKIHGMDLKLTGMRESVSNAVVMATEAKEIAKKKQEEVTAHVREVDEGRHQQGDKWPQGMASLHGRKVVAAE